MFFLFKIVFNLNKEYSRIRGPPEESILAACGGSEGGGKVHIVASTSQARALSWKYPAGPWFRQSKKVAIKTMISGDRFVILAMWKRAHGNL
jgi:hypothetical protein